MRKINEIFYSLQGEGAHTGVPSVFVRFSGCNLKCSFCDTQHHDGKMMTDDEIADVVNNYPGRWIILTGGEPTMWIDSKFVAYLKERTGKMVAIETNGTLPVPEDIDWVTVSPKCGIEGIADLPIRADRTDEIKVVDVGQDLEPYFSLQCRRNETLMYLQPCYVKDERQCKANRLRTVRRVLADPRWTLSVQLHRFLGIP